MIQPKEKFLLRVLIAWVLILCLSSLIEAAGSVTGGPAEVNPKINSFLKIVEKAASLEEVRIAFKSANFTSDELKVLKAELDKPLYANKLKAFEAKALPALPDQSQEIQKMKVAYEQQRNQKLQAYNLQVQTKLQAVSSRLKPTVLPTKTSPQLATALSQAKAVASIPVVRSISPQSAIVGQLIDVSGEKFGSTQGTVYIEIAPQQFQCSDIRSWSDTRVRLSIPSEVQSLVRDDNKTAKIYIGVQNGGVASGNVIVGPDPATVTPVITSINSTEITPGQLVYLEGRNFLNNQGQGIEWIQAGGVNFMVGAKSYTGNVTIWGDTYIGVMMPSMSGLLQQEGTLQVKNKRLLVSTPVRFTFVPTVDRLTFVSRFWCAAIAFFGCSHTFEDNNFLLINNWKVADAYLTKDNHGDADSYYQRRPSPGSTNALSVVRVWADAFCYTRCSNYLIIEGPLGLPYKQ